MAKTIVILGASVAGVPIAHYVAKHLAPKDPDLNVVLISPNTHFYWNLAATRGILPNKLDDDKLFYPLQDAFSSYSPSQFEHVLGKAVKLDPTEKKVTVRISCPDSHEKTFEYYALVVATGSSARESMPWKNLASTEDTKASLAKFRKQIDAAKTILVAGSGTTGCEVAGELGTAFGKNGLKTIILVSSNKLPLDEQVLPSVRQAAKNELEGFRVRVIDSAKVSKITNAGPDGEKRVTITTNGGKEETIETDVYLPTFGIAPNTDFLPAGMLDGKGFIQQNTFLQAQGYSDIFVAGDVGNLESANAAHADSQVVHVVKNIDAFLAGMPLLEYKADMKIQFGLALGDRGTGQAGDWKLWSLLVWFVKGRHLGTQYAAQIAAGTRTMNSKSW